MECGSLLPLFFVKRTYPFGSPKTFLLESELYKLQISSVFSFDIHTNCPGYPLPAAQTAVSAAENLFLVGWMEESLHSRKRSALAVLEFFVPGHLDGFELGFIGSGGIAGEAGELGDPFVHVGEAHGERIDVREFVGQTDGDVLEIVPTECRRHVHSRKKDLTPRAQRKDGGINPPLQQNQWSSSLA